MVLGYVPFELHPVVVQSPASFKMYTIVCGETPRTTWVFVGIVCVVICLCVSLCMIPGSQGNRCEADRQDEQVDQPQGCHPQGVCRDCCECCGAAVTSVMHMSCIIHYCMLSAVVHLCVLVLSHAEQQEMTMATCCMLSVLCPGCWYPDSEGRHWCHC